MALNRSTIIRGPAQIEFPAGSGKYYYSQGDIRLSVGYETFEIVNSAFGKVQERIRQRIANVSFTPVGNLIPSNDNPDLWYIYGALKSGAPLLGAPSHKRIGDAETDVNMVVWSYSGTKATIYNVGCTKLPDLILSTTKTFAGEVTFTGLGAGGIGGTIPTPSVGTDNFVKIETGQGAPTDAFNADDIITEPYTASLGSRPDPWNDLNTAQGWHLTFDLNLQPVVVDQFGIVDWTVGNVKATARGQIIGVSESDLIGDGKVIPVNVALGTGVVTQDDLVIKGSVLQAKIHNCIVKMSPLQYGLTTLRLADMEFEGQRKVDTNTHKPLPVFEVTKLNGSLPDID